MRPGSRYRSITDVVKALAGGRIVFEMFVDDFVLAAHFCLPENFFLGFGHSRRCRSRSTVHARRRGAHIYVVVYVVAAAPFRQFPLAVISRQFGLASAPIP